MSEKKQEFSGERYERLERRFRRKYGRNKQVLADAMELVDSMQMWTLTVWLNCIKAIKSRPKP